MLGTLYARTVVIIKAKFTYITILGLSTVTVFTIQVYYAVTNYYDLQLLNTSLEALINQYHKTYTEFNMQKLR